MCTLYSPSFFSFLAIVVVLGGEKKIPSSFLFSFLSFLKRKRKSNNFGLVGQWFSEETFALTTTYVARSTSTRNDG